MGKWIIHTLQAINSNWLAYCIKARINIRWIYSSVARSCITAKIRDGRAHKFYRRQQPENHQWTTLQGRIYRKSTQRAYLSFSAKYFSVHHCISGEHSDPSCPAQGHFTSSAVQTPFSQPCDNWSLGWYHCRAFVRCVPDVWRKREVGCLLLCTSVFCNCKLYFVFSVLFDNDGNKRGQDFSLCRWGSDTDKL